MLKKFGLSAKIYLLVIVPLLTELGLLAAMKSNVDSAQDEANKQAHVEQIIECADGIKTYPHQMYSDLFYFFTQRNPNYLEHYQNLERKQISETKRLIELLSDSPQDRDEIMRVQEKEDKMLSYVHSMVDEYNPSDPLHSAQNLKTFWSEMQTRGREPDEFIADVIGHQKQILSTFPRNLSELRNGQMLLIAAGAAVQVLLAITLAGTIARGVVRRVRLLVENTHHFATGMPLHPVIPGSDELAELDTVFHTMTDVINEAARKERAIIDHAADVICSIDSSSRFAKISPAAQRIWGVPPADLLGLNVLELILSDDVPAVAAAIEAAKKTGTESVFESRLRHRYNGSIVHMLWSAQWIPSEQTLFCVAHDITERKLAEEALRLAEARLRLIISTMPVGIAVLTEDAVIEMGNAALEEIFGHPLPECTGQHISTFFPLEGDASRQVFAQELYEKSIGHIYEREAIRKNGQRFPIHISITRYEAREGMRFLAAILDVTERHEIERFKREFLGVISHELRNPLTAIRGSLKMMMVGALGPLSEPATKAVTIAERSAGRLIGLVNDLLDIEKLEAGKLEMQFDMTPIGPVVENSIESLRPLADQHQVKIEQVNVQGSAFADADRLIQVVINLLSNAIKYSPREGIVKVAVVQHPEELEVRVIDQGRGIPPTHINALFQRFQQVERTDATKKGGTGLGLAICKAIIEQHQGTIGVESELGHGSTFWFRVPAKPVAPTQPAAAAAQSV